MMVNQLPIPSYLVDKLRGIGVEALYPPQAEAVSKGLLDGRNLLVATPTASGKTLLAALAASKHLDRGGRVVYLSPLRAITSEKKQFFEELFGDRYKVAAVSRDYDQPEEWLRGYDIVVSTNEKMDSMLRHSASWVKSTSLVVVDEVHMLAAEERGSTLEVLITRLLTELPNAQFLLLSATIRNVEDLAEYTGADIVSSSWRPVPLREAVYQQDRDELFFSDGSSERLPRLSSDPVKNLVLNIVSIGGQVLVFASSRRAAEGIADDLASALRVVGGEAAQLSALAETVYDGGDCSTRLARYIRRGTAFHHAGLYPHQRKAVEDAFRAGLLKAIVATPTLAAGVNLPARAVIIPDVKRGGEDMSVMEYKQLCGRAGRPGFDKEGLAVIIAKNSRQRNEMMRRYVHGQLEPIVSRLSDQRRLRFHTLGLVSSGFSDHNELVAFFEKTLASRQDSGLMEKVDSALSYLEAAKFIKHDGGGWRATRLGKRVADLYIDPLSARIILSRLEDVEKAGPKADDVALLTICSTPDIELLSHIQPALDWFRDYGDFDGPAIAKASVLKAWVEEMGESTIESRFGAAPGDIYVLSESGSWIAQAASELAAMVGRRQASKTFLVLSERIKHGVREELLPLCSLPGIGRVRARALWNAGIRRVEDLRRISTEHLAKIIGQSTATRVLEVVRER
uniref:ATP-dependent DNA helicase Hel308 n=1 Tax=Caldiarchaeum subterraneum TaxID=311458 RepID=A0A7J3G6Y4_CALS0